MGENIIISQLSSEQTVYELNLFHHHSVHSSPHHQINFIFPIKKGYFIRSSYATSSEQPSLQSIPPPHQHILLSLFFGKMTISILSSEQTVYQWILSHHQRLYSSLHHQRAYFTIQMGYLITICYPTPSADPILQFITPAYQQKLLSYF